MAELAYWIHADLTNKEIGYEMGIAETSVKTTTARLKECLGVKSRIGVALWVERKLREAEKTAVSDIGPRLAVS